MVVLGLARKEGFLTPEVEREIDNLSDSDKAIMEHYKRRLSAGSEASAKPANDDAPNPANTDASHASVNLADTRGASGPPKEAARLPRVTRPID